MISNALNKAQNATKVDKLAAEFKDKAERWVKVKTHRKINAGLEVLPDIIKDELEDPDMPAFVSFRKDKAIDAIWPDLKEAIMYEVAVLLDSDVKREQQFGEPSGTTRARGRYLFYPYDRSLWHKGRQPGWLFLIMLSMLPFSVVTSSIFLVFFLLIDRSDEYMLVMFILEFKTTIFFAHGIIRTLVGFLMYFFCVTVPAEEDQHDCDVYGPGLWEPVFLILGGWALSAVLLYSAVALLPFSTNRRREKLKGNVDYGLYEGQSIGVYLQLLMLYDTFLAFALAGSFVLVVWSRPGWAYNDWVARNYLYAIQILYGYSALPFFLLSLPFVHNILAHTTPTGFDRSGRLTVQRRRKRNPNQMRSVLKEIGVTTEEASKLVDSMKQRAINSVVPTKLRGEHKSLAAAAASPATAEEEE